MEQREAGTTIPRSIFSTCCRHPAGTTSKTQAPSWVSAIIPPTLDKILSAHVCMAAGNEAGLRTFGYTWDEFTALPSRKSCEEDVRAERAELLQNVREFDKTAPAVDYSGVSYRATAVVKQESPEQARLPTTLFLWAGPQYTEGRQTAS